MGVRPSREAPPTHEIPTKHEYISPRFGHVFAVRLWQGRLPAPGSGQNLQLAVANCSTAEEQEATFESWKQEEEQLRLFEQFEYGIVFFSRGKVFHEKKTWCRCIRCGACQRRRKEAPEGLPALRAEFSAEGHLLWARAMEKWFAEDPTRRRGGVAPSPLWDTIDTLTSGLSRVFTAALWVGALLLLLMALWALVPDGDEPSLLKLARREPLVYVLLGIALVPALVRPGALAAKLLELEARQLVPEASPACPAALAAAITAAAIGLRAALTALAASFTGLQAVYKAAATGLWTVRAAAAAAITGLRAALSAATAVAGLQLQAALAPLAAAARGLRAAVAAAMAVLRATVAALAAAVTGVAAALAAAIAAVAAALAAALAALVLAPASLARRMQQRQRQRQQRQQERCSAEGPGAAPPAPQPQPAGSAGGPGSSDGAGSAAVSEQAAPVGFVPAARHEELKQRLAEVQEHLGRLREAHADALRSELEEHATCSVSHEVFTDPVCAADGHSFEREAIQRWMARHPEPGPVLTPLTNLPLPSRALTPNLALRSLAERLQQLVQEGEGPSAG